MDQGYPDTVYRDLDVRRAVPVRMRDGVALLADVYAPQGEGPWPVLLMRVVDGREVAGTRAYANPAWFARRGFLVVIQEVRGTGDSEGEFMPFQNEGPDGSDTIAWAAGLTGSNGCVGMYGYGYAGCAQWYAATERPEALRAMAPHMATLDPYGWFYRDGILQRQTAEWGDMLGTEAPAYVHEWLAHPRKDEFWQALDLTAEAGALALPVFHLAGWYHGGLRGAMASYRALASQRPETQFLVVGPWAQPPWGERLGGVDFGAGTRLDIDSLLVDFFSAHLKGEDAEPPRGVRYFSLGENIWRTSQGWPPPEDEIQHFYLSCDIRSNSCFGDGMLVFKPFGPSDTFVDDPEDPVLAPGGARDATITWGPAELSLQHEQNNLLVFTTPALEQNLFVAGVPRCVLFVHSDAKEMGFMVRLSRVSRRSCRFLCLGAALLSSGQAMDDGSVKLEIALDDVACRFAAGERIRVDVSSSAWPLLELKPEQASVLQAQQKPRLQTLYHDQQHPTALTLPILPDSGHNARINRSGDK